MVEKNKIYETDFTKGVYKLEDFCNALRDNNCIIDTKVFVNWQDLVNINWWDAHSSPYDSVRFVIFNKVGELTYGQWIACNHDLVITDYVKQEWKDFYPLNENTSRIWERLLFCSAVKPVGKDYFDNKNHPSKQSFKIDEVVKIVRNSTYFDELSLIEAVSLRKDIFDLMDMVGFVKEVKYDANAKNWIAQYDGGMITMPSWIGNILDKEYLDKEVKK